MRCGNAAFEKSDSGADRFGRDCVYSIRTVGSTKQRAAHFTDDRGKPVVRQAGSEGPVRCTVADRKQDGSSKKLRATGRTCGDGGV